jgi:hypothetical protein
MPAWPPVLFRRFPRPRWRAQPGAAIVPPEEREAHPALARDLALLDDELLPAFRRLDALALFEQNRFRRQQVVLILGGAATTVFAAVQASLSGQTWPGLAVSLLAGATTTVSATARRRGSLDAYFTARVRAERLRRLYFRFLGGRDVPVAAEARRRWLVAAVVAVEQGEEVP